MHIQSSSLLKKTKCGKNGETLDVSNKQDIKQIKYIFSKAGKDRTEAEISLVYNSLNKKIAYFRDTLIDKWGFTE